MAEEKNDAASESAASTPGPSKMSALKNPHTLLMLLNTLFVLLALGTVVKIKLLFERPAISEKAELEKQIQAVEANASHNDQERMIYKLDSATVNIAMTNGKAHYVTLEMAIECKNAQVHAKITAKKDQIMDRLLNTLGKRQMTELSTVQGKLLLKNELQREFDAVIEEVGGIYDIYFSTFTLQ